MKFYTHLICDFEEWRQRSLLLTNWVDYKHWHRLYEISYQQMVYYTEKVVKEQERNKEQPIVDNFDTPKTDSIENAVSLEVADVVQSIEIDELQDKATVLRFFFFLQG